MSCIVGKLRPYFFRCICAQSAQREQEQRGELPVGHGECSWDGEMQRGRVKTAGPIRTWLLEVTSGRSCPLGELQPRQGEELCPIEPRPILIAPDRKARTRRPHHSFASTPQRGTLQRSSIANARSTVLCSLTTSLFAPIAYYTPPCVGSAATCIAWSPRLGAIERFLLHCH
jgi:hypothetical protein